CFSLYSSTKSCFLCFLMILLLLFFNHLTAEGNSAPSSHNKTTLYGIYYVIFAILHFKWFAAPRRLSLLEHSFTLRARGKLLHPPLRLPLNPHLHPHRLQSPQSQQLT